jgi:hypothetical protein
MLQLFADDAGERFASDRLAGGEDRCLDPVHPFPPTRFRRQMIQLCARRSYITNDNLAVSIIYASRAIVYVSATLLALLTQCLASTLWPSEARSSHSQPGVHTPVAGSAKKFQEQAHSASAGVTNPCRSRL